MYYNIGQKPIKQAVISSVLKSVIHILRHTEHYFPYTLSVKKINPKNVSVSVHTCEIMYLNTCVRFEVRELKCP